MNIILDDTQREKYKDTINILKTVCPETISRKIDRANVQQGFMLDQVLSLTHSTSELLCVGSFEDTACEALKSYGRNIHEIDPEINISLDTFFKSTTQKFDVVFSTSVIEHVGNDEIFLDQICKLIKPGGYGVLTCDFNNDYKIGDAKPKEDYRLYTKHDLLGRLNKILLDNGCSLYGEINYDAKPDFHYGGCVYSFATYTFVKSV